MRHMLVPSLQYAFVSVGVVGLDAACVNRTNCRSVHVRATGARFFLSVFIASSPLVPVHVQWFVSCCHASVVAIISWLEGHDSTIKLWPHLWCMCSTAGRFGPGHHCPLASLSTCMFTLHVMHSLAVRGVPPRDVLLVMLKSMFPDYSGCRHSISVDEQPIGCTNLIQCCPRDFRLRSRMGTPTGVG